MKNPASVSTKSAPVAALASFLVALLATAASIRGLFNDFVYDDIPIIRDNVRVHGLGHIGEIFTQPYWPPPFVEQLYRPLSLALASGEYAVGQGNPLVFRLTSYALYAVTAVLVYRLAKRLLPVEIAFVVGVLFAVHPVHVETVALGVNQAELLVAICALLMVTLYVDRRRSGSMTWASWVALASLYAAATLFKETGFVLPLLLMVADVTVLRGAGPQPRTSYVAGYGALGVVAITSFLIRTSVLAGKSFDVVPAADLAGLSLGGRMLFMLHVVPMWLRLLAWPAHLQVDFAPGEIAARGTFGFGGFVGLLLVLLWIAGVALTMRRSPVFAFGLLWIGATLVPVVNIIPTGVVLGERTLLLPSIGFLIAVGAVVSHVLASPVAQGATVRRVLASAAAVLLVLGLLRSGGRHAVWNTSHLTIKQPSGVLRPPD